ncbi:hypothetical protein CXF85_19840 [Colwellia sp. 75C3]|uniref:hypothetical protein n=1 Tax=Colwellia sp. 75C3 TaxID=888425 RepID=UPI000C3266CA|nr:hypothetical protein [Colwellia sp. 75C3]PKG81017.1 hypothetical protein CXF85_19840 [Colwellia sp. 75C3]
MKKIILLALAAVSFTALAHDYDGNDYDTSTLYMAIWENESKVSELQSKVSDLEDQVTKLIRTVRQLKNEH